MKTWHPRLHVYLAWHPDAAPALGEELAAAIAQRISRDTTRPFDRDIGIPVFFHSAAPEGEPTPPSIHWDQALQTVVVVLIEGTMLRDHAWVEHVRAVYKEALGQNKHHLLPIGLAEGAHNLLSMASDALTAYALVEDAEERRARVIRLVVQELCRYLSDAPVEPGASPRPLNLFISHTKRVAADEALANLFKQVVEDNPLGRFFDTVSIAPGYKLSDEIRRGLKTAAVVAIRTDVYTSSHWCQWEVIEAKRLRRPMVILDLLNKREKRFFPDLANVPSTRLQLPPDEDEDDIRRRMQAALDEVIEEVLAYTYVLELLRYWQRQGCLPEHATLLARPPENGDVLEALDAGAEAEAREATASLLVYPEPPVSEAEQRARSHHTRVRIATPLTLHRGSLKGMTLGISISGGDEETSAADLGRHGLTQEHLDAALFAFSRHAVAHGATVAYGGDLRPGGFTENLFEYLHACKAAGLEDFERVRNYLAWPLHLRIDGDWWGLNMDVVELREMPLPEDLLQAGIDPEQFLPPNGPENRYLWARCLTSMRRTMAREIHARILACGKWTNYLGRLPGLMEEALLALEEGTPLFLLGGFGGVTEMLIEALRGKHPVPLTEAYQRKNDDYATMLVRYRGEQKVRPGQIPPVDYEAAVNHLRGCGTACLNNELSPEENEVLFATRDAVQAMALVFEGLRRIQAKKPA